MPPPCRHMVHAVSNVRTSPAYTISQELKLQDGDVDYLPPEYKDAVDNAAAMKAAALDDPDPMERAVALVRGMYLDHARCGAGANGVENTEKPLSCT